jgi:hypothetical protein
MAPNKPRNHDKRMAVVTANWKQVRQPSTAEQIMATLHDSVGHKKSKGLRRSAKETLSCS